jgi:hypothetical protein
MIGRELLPFTEPIIRNYSATAINLLSQNGDFSWNKFVYFVLCVPSADHVL